MRCLFVFCLLNIVCCLLFDACCVSSVWFVECVLSVVRWCSLFVVCDVFLFGSHVDCLLFVVCCLLSVVLVLVDALYVLFVV